MKKIILLFSIMTCTNFFAQKQEPKNVTLELEFAPLGASPLKISSLRGRYFIDEIQAFRLSFFAGGTYTPTEYETPGLETLTDKEREINFVFRPGYEYHFDGTDKLSPYVGGEVFLSTKSTKSSEENYRSDNRIKTDITKTSKSPVGLNIFAGGDYYFTDKIYLGAEVGFGFTREGKGKTKYELENGEAGEIAPEDFKGNSSLLNWGPNYQATIRLGFCIK